MSEYGGWGEREASIPGSELEKLYCQHATNHKRECRKRNRSSGCQSVCSEFVLPAEVAGSNDV